MKIRYYLSCLFFLFLQFLTPDLFGNKIERVDVIHHLDEESGLNAKTVYSALQDRNGFIWFATDAGIFKYDGIVFKRFTVDNGVSDNEILQIYEDRIGRIWFLTYNGYLSYWFKGKIYNPENTPFLRKAYLGASVVYAREDNSGNLWLGCFKGGFIVINDTNVKLFKVHSPLRDEISSFIQFDKNDAPYFGYRDKLVSFSRTDTSDLKGGVLVCSSAGSNTEMIYLCFNGIYKLSGKVSKLLISSKYLPYHLKIASLNCYDNEIWVSTLGEGCLLYKDGKFVKRYLDGNSVSTVLKDRDGNIWFNTMNDGAYVLYSNTRSVNNYDVRSGLAQQKIMSVTVTNDESIWLGFTNGTVECLKSDERTSFLLKANNAPKYLRILGLYYSKDTVWCGTDIGIFYIHKNKVYRVPYLDLNGMDINYSIKHITADKSGNIYASFSLNYIKVEKTKYGLYSHPLLDTILRTFSSTQSVDGKLYVSTLTGIVQFSNDSTFSILNTSTDFSHLRILDMKSDPNGSIILSTNSDGIYVLKESKLIQHITVKDLLSDNNCGRLFLKNSLLYVCTGNGLNIFNKEDGKWVHEKTLTVRDGLLSNVINDIYVTDSSIYIATDKGLSIVPVNDYNLKEFEKNVLVTEIVTDTTYIVNSDNFEFDSDFPRLIIRYSCPSFFLYNKLKVKYRLLKDGISGEWVSTNNNEVEFSSLPPGKYLFEIKLDEKRGLKVPVTKMSINVLPMWYQTILAKFFIVLILITGIIWVIRRRLKSQYDRRLKLVTERSIIETERNRIASDMHDDIGADLTQISIWSNVLRSKGIAADGIIEKIGKLSNGVLEKMDQIIWALNSIHNQSVNLFTYLRSYTAEYLEGVDMSFTFDVDSDVPDLPIGMYQRRNVFLVYKELLHNTVKHSNAGKVCVKVSIDKEFLYIVYQDDGKGVTPEKDQYGLGLSTMVKRMEDIGSFITFDSTSGKGFKAILKIRIESYNQS